jgi:hypothetical protein
MANHQEQNLDSNASETGQLKTPAGLDVMALYGDFQKPPHSPADLNETKVAMIPQENGAFNTELTFNADNFYGSAFNGQDSTKAKKLEANDHQELSKPQDQGKVPLEHAREQLSLDAALLIENPKERQQFLDNMKVFEARQKNGEISPEEVTKTYQNIDQLLTSVDGKIPPKDRILLTQNFMHLAAYPSESDQGIYNTCNVTALQEKLLTRHPTKVAGMLAEAGITGGYTAPDGKSIQLDLESMKPIANFKGEANATPVDGVRSYGTQVINHILVNEITQRKTDKHDTMLYVQRHERSQEDRGERLLSMRDGSEMTFRNTEEPIRGPGLTSKDVTEALKRHTGEDDSFLVKGSGGRLADGRIAINSEEELVAAITKAKRENRTPLLVEVNGADPLFQGGFPDGQHAGHVVSVSDYDPQTKQIYVSNQWGSDNDIMADSKDFYKTMINALDSKRT